MELIKKIIVQATTTGTTSGCTSCYVIIPDLDAVYHMKVLLTSDGTDWGFFDVSEDYNPNGEED